jgi:hypothetical protein
MFMYFIIREIYVKLFKDIIKLFTKFSEKN